ncbi:MAG: porin family protein [Bacteroidaceae bacterium]|nr:porin family protein [Bacteroidaceae bacterium]
MKKIFASLVVLLVSVAMNAQVYVGGGIGFSNVENTANNSKVTSYVIQPEIGYKLDDKWSIGTNIDFEYAKEDTYKATSFAVGPYVRYNAFKVGAVTFFADASAEIATLKVDGGDSYSGWAVGIQPGVSVNVTDKLMFVAHTGGIGYFDTEDINNLKGFDANFSTGDLSFSLLWSF